MSKPETQYHAHRLGSIVNLMIGIMKNDPTVIDDRDRLISMMKYTMPELSRKDVCPCCDASMQEYIFTFDAWNALLLMKMAEEIRHRMSKGMEFTIANQVRIPELDANYALKCRTTYASKLGLVAQLRNRNDKRVAGTWVITRRGWEALAGKPVPKMVRVWRGKIEERYDEKTTLAAALKSHVDYVEKMHKRGKTPTHDYRDMALEYDPSRWTGWSTQG